MHGELVMKNFVLLPSQRLVSSLRKAYSYRREADRRTLEDDKAVGPKSECPHVGAGMASDSCEWLVFADFSCEVTDLFPPASGYTRTVSKD